MKIGKTLDEKIESLYQGTRKTISFDEFKKCIYIFIKSSIKNERISVCLLCKHDGLDSCFSRSERCKNEKIRILKEYKIL